MKVAFYKSRKRITDRIVSWWTDGPYSHCELVLFEHEGESLCMSSSIRDGGVRMKWIKLDPEHWDILDLGDLFDQVGALLWYEKHVGAKYDYLGLLGFVWRPIRGVFNRFFCSEATAGALGFSEAWRYCPNALYSCLTRIVKLRISQS